MQEASEAVFPAHCRIHGPACDHSAATGHHLTHTCRVVEPLAGGSPQLSLQPGLGKAHLSCLVRSQLPKSPESLPNTVKVKKMSFNNILPE